MGCRERARGSVALPGDRPSGILTAGTAQRYVNIEGLAVGKRVVVLGSGDIGLIMARRMTLEGAKVLACVELMPYSGGLNRNIVQCLNDYDIPLYLSHTVTGIRGKKRLTGVTVSRVDDCFHPVPGTEIDFFCDTLLLSVGLIPENELTRAAGIKMDPRTRGAVVYENNETSLPGVFACGNVLHVHDIADLVTVESQRAGRAAARYVLHGKTPDSSVVSVQYGEGLVYALPQKIRIKIADDVTTVYFRVNRIFCSGTVHVYGLCGEIASFKRTHMAPGEMQRIKLSRELLQKSGGEITVSAKEADA
jgi:NADPH-dependent 2,4-dienoyl-CoA reductase/sulfur reductase-like enzyme